MLLITRRIGESFRIGEDVWVRILAVKGSQVRVGIEAPRDVHVMREELVKRDEQQQREAAP